MKSWKDSRRNACQKWALKGRVTKPGEQRGCQYSRQRMQQGHNDETEHEGGGVTITYGWARSMRLGWKRVGSLEDLWFWRGRYQIMERFKYHNKEFRLYPINIWFLSNIVKLVETSTNLSGKTWDWQQGLPSICSNMEGVWGGKGEERFKTVILTIPRLKVFSIQTSHPKF